MRQLARRVWRRVRRLLQQNQATLVGSLAGVYLRGEGIEIGALHNPLLVPAKARVRYVDRMPELALRQHYPELGKERLVPIDIVDDGETLPHIADASQDFVIANNFLEHCQDPIGTLKHLFRVLRPGGVLYMAIPDKRYTFDRARPVTPLEHLVTDHIEGPERSRRAHYEEFARLVDGVTEAALEQTVNLTMQRDYSIHFHVWTQKEMLELLLSLKGRLRFDFEAMCKNRSEVIFVLRKESGSSADVP